MPDAASPAGRRARASPCCDDRAPWTLIARGEPALPLRHVVGDVGDEVGVPAVGLSHHAVLVVAVVGRPAATARRPARTSCRTRRAARRSASTRPVGVERALEVVVVETSRRTPAGPGPARGAARRRRSVRIDSTSPKIVPDFVRDTLRDLADVLAAVAVLRKRRLLAQELLRARTHRDREVLGSAGRRRCSRTCASTLAPCHSSSVAIASPSAAWRPWPTCRGPVGLAETNSTMTPAVARASPRAEVVALGEDRARRPLWRAEGVTKMLMNPAPAISIRSDPGSFGGSAATSACASIARIAFRAPSHAGARRSRRSRRAAPASAARVSTGVPARSGAIGGDAEREEPSSLGSQIGHEDAASAPSATNSRRVAFAAAISGA